MKVQPLLIAGPQILAALLLAQELVAAPILPPLYRGGVNLGTNCGQVSQAITFWKDTLYVGVEAQTCWPNQPLSSATVTSASHGIPEVTSGRIPIL